MTFAQGPGRQKDERGYLFSLLGQHLGHIVNLPHLPPIYLEGMSKAR